MYSKVQETLVSALAPKLPPIAVCFSNERPAGSRVESPAAAGCEFWERAASGPIVTSAADHEMCAIGVYTHNLAEPGSELLSVLKVLGEMQYVRAEDIAQIPVAAQRARYITYAPLSQAPSRADVVLIFADSRQGLVITEAVQQVDNGAPPALGRPACAAIPQAMNSGRAALSLGCCGARAYLGIMSDETAMWAFPGSRIEEYAERIAALANANRVLGEFHRLRKRDIEAGVRPTYAESLVRLSGGSGI